MFRENLVEEELMGFDQDNNNNIDIAEREPRREEIQTKKKSLFAVEARRGINDNMKRKGEKEILQQVIGEIETISAKRMSEGFNQFNFSLGVFNCFFIVYTFGE